MLLSRLPTILAGMLLCAVVYAGEAEPTTTEKSAFAYRFTAAEMGATAPIHCVATHPDGRVFAGSESGLHVFDGKTWSTVTGLAPGPIRALGIDGAGRVWFAGVEQFGTLESNEHGMLVSRLVSAPFVAEAPRLLAYDNPRRQIQFVGTDAFVVFGDRALIVRVDVAGHVNPIHLRTDGRIILTALRWTGALYVQTTDAAFRVQGDRVERISETDLLWRPAAGYLIHSIWPAPGGEAWVTTDHELRRVRRDGSIVLAHDFSRALGSRDTFGQGAPLAEGLAAVGTGAHGVWIVDSEGRVRARLDKKNGLGEGGDNISTLVIDENGRLWAAHGGGLACIDSKQLQLPAINKAEEPVAPPPRFSGTPLTRIFSAKQTGITHQQAVSVHPNGLLYVGGLDGLLEFDGASWRAVAGLANQAIFTIAIDSVGRVFYGGLREFGMLVPDENGLTRARPLQDRLPAADRPTGRVEVLAVDAEAYCLFSSLNVVVRVDPHGEPHAIRCPVTPQRLLAWDGVVYVQTENTVLRLVNDVALPDTGDSPASKNSSKYTITALWPDGGGGAWQFDYLGVRHWRPDTSPISQDVVTLSRANVVAPRGGIPIGDGTFALSGSNGVVRGGTNGAVEAVYGEASGAGLGSNSTWGLARDGEGGLWIAHNGGVTRVQVRGAAVGHGPGVGLHGVAGAFAVHAGRLYVGTSDGLYARDPLTGRFAALREFFSAVALASAADALLVGGSDRLGALHDDGTVESVESKAADIQAMTATPYDPTCVVAGTSAGLRLYRRTAGKWQRAGGVASVRGGISQLAFDAAGSLWALHNNRELLRLDWREGPRLDAKMETFGAAEGLPLDGKPRTRARLVMLGGGPALAVDGAMVRFDPATNRFVPETRIAGLAPNEATSYLFPLRDGGFFMVQPTGARRLGLARPTGAGAWRMEWQPYTGFESIRPTAAFDDPLSGAIWFGDENIASFEPGVDALVAPPPAARVRLVTTAADKTIWAGGGEPPHTPLPPEQNTVAIGFAAPSFRTDADGTVGVQYRTKLDGLDRAWSPWGPETRRNYANLPPGRFTFRVQARGDDRREGPESSFAFQLLAPWWRTWWFIGLASMSGVASVAGVTRWYSQRVFRRRVALLEAQSAVERERLRLARDLHDEVGSGLGRVILFAGEAEQAEEDPVERRASLARVRRTAQELMQHAREIVWAVSPQHDTLASLIERLRDYTVETLRAAGIACRVEVPAVEVPAITVSSEARHSLFLAMKEAVHNCVKYSGAKTAELRLAITGDDFVIQLQDHGRGFVAGEILGTGHGLVNIAARAKVLGGDATIVSAPGQGTMVTLRLPLHSEALTKNRPSSAARGKPPA